MPTTPFSIRLDAGTRARLEREAEFEDRSASYLAQKAIVDFIRNREYMRECLALAEAEADKGVLISEEAMNAWVASWGSDDELPPPEPDIFPEVKKT